jgi:tRNA-2-methylthio-N6-dimethylallyladenosine synthase
MIRRYTRAEYTQRVRRLLASRPDMTISTDVIVGFPGETEADFRATLDLIQEIGFTGVFAFKYSPRPFTPALKLADDVTEAEKSDRLARLFEITEAQIQAHLRSLVGSRQSVLVEGPGKSPMTWEGRTIRNEIVHMDLSDLEGDRAPASLAGETIEVDITQAFKHSLGAKPAVGALAFLASLPPTPARPPRRRRALPLLAE